MRDRLKLRGEADGLAPNEDGKRKDLSSTLISSFSRAYHPHLPPASSTPEDLSIRSSMRINLIRCNNRPRGNHSRRYVSGRNAEIGLLDEMEIKNGNNEIAENGSENESE